MIPGQIQKANWRMFARLSVERESFTGRMLWAPWQSAHFCGLGG